DVAAPGHRIQSTLSTAYAGNPSTDISRDGKHVSFSGTSFASPYTAGAVALLLQQNPNLTTAQALSDLKASAHGDAQASGLPNSTWGAGKVLVTPIVSPAATALSASALSQ